MAEANAIDMVGAPNPKIQKTGKKQGKKVRKRLKQELAQLMMGEFSLQTHTHSAAQRGAAQRSTTRHNNVTRPRA